MPTTMKYSVFFIIIVAFVMPCTIAQSGKPDDCYGKTCKPEEYCSEAEINKKCMKCTHLLAWCPQSDKIAEKYPHCAYVCEVKKYQEALDNSEQSYKELESDYAKFTQTVHIVAVVVGVLVSVMIVGLFICLCRCRQTNATLRKNAENANSVSTARPQNNTKKSLRSLCPLWPSPYLKVFSQPEREGQEDPSLQPSSESHSLVNSAQATSQVIAQPDSESPNHGEGDNITINTTAAVVDETERPKMQRNSGSINDDSGNDSSNSSPTISERKAVMVAPTGDRTEHDHGDQHDFMKNIELAVC